MNQIYQNWSSSMILGNCLSYLSTTDLFPVLEKRFPDLDFPIRDITPILLKACYHFFRTDQIGKLILEEYKIFKENPQIKFTDRAAKICTQKWINFHGSKRNNRKRVDDLIQRILDIIYCEWEIANLMNTENESYRVLTKTIYDLLNNNCDRYTNLAENRETMSDLYHLMQRKYPNSDISEDMYQLEFYTSFNEFFN